MSYLSLIIKMVLGKFLRNQGWHYSIATYTLPVAIRHKEFVIDSYLLGISQGINYEKEEFIL